MCALSRGNGVKGEGPSVPHKSHEIVKEGELISSI